MTALFLSWLGHGAASLAQPGVFTGAKGHVFSVDAETAAIQHLADKLLNPAGGGIVRYQAALPIALFSFLDIASCTSGTDIVGWLPGREAGIWAPLLEFRSGELPPRLVFWAPYIFIDYTIGMVTGREAWGWPKVGAKIGVPSDTPGGTDFTCETTYFPTLAATTRGQHGMLYRVTQTLPAGGPAPVWESTAEAAAGLIGGLLGGLAAGVLDAFGLQPQIDCVVLKQFRASSTPTLACYQAIVNSPVKVTDFTGAGPLLGEYAVEITNCASHTIVEDLTGVGPVGGVTTLPVSFAAWANVDFEAPVGSEIVVTS